MVCVCSKILFIGRYNMLKLRIIPLLLLKNGRVVKTKQFGEYRDVGDPITAARVYDAQRADELLFLDIAASVEGRQTLLDIVRVVAEECFMPLGVGGGIRSLEQMKELFHNGADKVIINTAAWAVPGLITAAAEKFGSSNVVVSIDAKKNSAGEYEVFTAGGTKPTGQHPVYWARTMAQAGAGEIMITSIDREGTMAGLDLELIRSVAAAVSVPVIASGGIGALSDFKDGFIEGHAAAVAAGSIFHFTDQSPIMARNYLLNQGIIVRR